MTALIDTKPKTIYAGRNPAETPCYALKEAARYLHWPAAAVRIWVLGRKRPTGAGATEFQPLLKIADPHTPLLSFHDVAEMHVAGAMRREQPVNLHAVRKAIAFARKTFATQYPLSSGQMLTDGKDLFIAHFGRLASLSEQGQVALKGILEIYLDRIDRNPAGVPIRLFPFTRADISPGSPKAVAIDPRVQFGRPCIAGTGIATEIVMERYLAGESIKELADDYGCPLHGIEEAIRYENVA